MKERESPAYYRGVLDGFRREAATCHAAAERLARWRLPQWERLLRDYKSALRELEELKKRQ